MFFHRLHLNRGKRKGPPSLKQTKAVVPLLFATLKGSLYARNVSDVCA